MPKLPDDELELVEEEDDSEAKVEYDIASYPSDLTLSGIHEMWKNGDIVIPDFQRNYVWNLKQASTLIESFLLGLPVPQVFLFLGEDGKSLVIDGQQRITSVVFFLEGFFGHENIQGRKQVFRLQGISDKSPYYGKRFIDLDEPDQRRLKNNSILRAINIRQLSPKGEKTSIYHIFERLNTGGTPLKPQEIRNCVFRGHLVTVLKELNQNKDWRAILGKKTIDRHQKDVELILRVFALSDSWDSYEKPIKEFLNKFMEKEKDGKSSKVKKFQKNFAAVAAQVAKELGSKPFHIRGPLNTSVLDSVFCTLIENSEKKPKNLKTRFDKLVKDSKFKTATELATSDVAVLKDRFKMTKVALLGK